MWAITTLFQPVPSKVRVANYYRFLEQLTVPVCTVEIAFGNQEFSLKRGDANLLIQLRSNSILWQKEAALNHGFRTIEEETDFVAVIDSDIIFTEPCVLETKKKLKDYAAIQLFRFAQGSHSKKNIVGLVASVQAYGEGGLNNSELHGHRGYAWAYRKEVLQNGLYPYSIVGGADHEAAYAMFGKGRTTWGQKFYELVKGKVSYVNNEIIHLDHGSVKGRQY